MTDPASRRYDNIRPIHTYDEHVYWLKVRHEIEKFMSLAPAAIERLLIEGNKEG